MLKYCDIELLSADLGEESLIPDICDVATLPFFKCDESADEKDLCNLGIGVKKTTLPYKTQNMYNRKLSKKKYKCVVLENEFLRAEFLPEFGGRLWSLFDKKNNKDLVYRNDALIFANLGFSNAWFAGGIEWNVGIRGHAALGCRSMFACKAIGKTGNEILRLYAYEEKRGIIYCINATLDQDKLLIKPEIINVSGKDVYMYWWSNIAVEETDKTRTLVPAKYSYITSYREGGYNISRKAIPFINGKEISYCGNANEPIDYFYDVEGEKKWICSVSEKGDGLMQCSSENLIGRKNFMWGRNNGGRHWNKWLTLGRDYYEIQAGLLKTQFESFVMKKDQSVSFVESYFGIKLNDCNGEFYKLCLNAEKLFSNPKEREFMFEIENCELPFHLGDGKGYVASLYNGKDFDGFVFPKESVRKEQSYYLDLFYDKTTKIYEGTDFCANDKVLEKLAKKQERVGFEDYLLAIGLYEKEEYDKAYELLKTAVKKDRNYLHLTALALYEDGFTHNRSLAFELIKEAVKIRPNYYPLVCVFGEIAIRSEKYAEFCEFYENSCIEIKNNGRIKMHASLCYANIDELEKASSLIDNQLEVADVREGEYSVSNVYIFVKKKIMAKATGALMEEISDKQVLEKYPLPFELDFRMHPKKD